MACFACQCFCAYFPKCDRCIKCHFLLGLKFIETAKEISHLEQDMYRLSAIITEQRKFLVGLQDTSLLGDSVPLTISLEPEEEPKGSEEDSRTANRQEEGRRKLVELMENVEGEVS